MKDGPRPGRARHGEWCARYKRPDGTWGSRSGFPTKKAAEDWGLEQDALIRRNLWLDPRDGETRFEDFAEEWLTAVTPRLELNTVAKYRSFLDSQLLPQWKAWPLVAIFNGYVEIERWLSELHEDCAESSVSSYFALFSTILNGAVRARMIPANPCNGVRVSKGGYDTERLVGTPAQALRAAMRLYELGFGISGFVLCLMDFYTGARRGELVGQQRHEYDRCGGGTPGRRRSAPKPCGDSVCGVASGDRGALRRADGQPWGEVDLDESGAGERRPPILSTFTFHEGRRTHATWLTEDGIPEVARRARLGQQMKGIARVYDRDAGDGEPDPGCVGGTPAAVAGVPVPG